MYYIGVNKLKRWILHSAWIEISLPVFSFIAMFSEVAYYGYLWNYFAKLNFILFKNTAESRYNLNVIHRAFLSKNSLCFNINSNL